MVYVSLFSFTLFNNNCRYDFVNSDGSQVKANGFRSILFLLSSCLQTLLDALQKEAKERGGFFYSAIHHLDKLCIYCRALQVLCFMLSFTFIELLYNNKQHRNVISLNLLE